MIRSARAVARANIALSKYWGKSDDKLNLPAVPSVSVTLEALRTETRVDFDERLDRDTFVLDGQVARAGEARRVVAMLDDIRALSGLQSRARVESTNHFPTAAGLASSASGFAALAGAATLAAGLESTPAALSALARRASASAARSIYGGFVHLPAGVEGDDSLCAQPIAGPEHWDLRVVVAVTTEGRKSASSRDAMGESRRSSPYYSAWLELSERLCPQVMAALMDKDLKRLIPLVEQSTMAMHSLAMTSTPAVYYWRPATMAVLLAVREMQEEGMLVGSTMDAGPHVKVFCEAADAQHVQDRLGAVAGVLRTLVAAPGPGIELERL